MGRRLSRQLDKTGRILQVGSQRVSNVLCEGAGLAGLWSDWEAESGRRAVGSEFVDRRVELLGAAGCFAETCDWPQFLGTAPKIPFSGERFFQWRKWKDYGSGVAGDLFVHLFSGTHFITGSHGPTRATGDR